MMLQSTKIKYLRNEQKYANNNNNKISQQKGSDDEQQEQEFPWIPWWNNVLAQLKGEESDDNENIIDNQMNREQQYWRKFDLINAPKISSRSWIAMDANTGRMVWGRNEHTRKEIASLTKIMTCYVSLMIVEKLEIDMSMTYVQVSANASQIIGTTANLREGDILSVRDLLYALMLPSGNDAAVVLAENFGVYYYFQSKEFNLKYGNQDKISNLVIQNPIQYFLKEMNDTAQKLGLMNTFYGNPHGLSTRLSRSTAYDVAKLCITCLENKQFRQIVNSKRYDCKIQNMGVSREVQWENTNRLLDYGFYGIKTGITNEAGPCLASYFKTKLHGYLIVLLNCTTKEERWIETCKIVKWISNLYENRKN